MADLDQTPALLIKGYAWLPDLRRRARGRPVETRVMGQRAVAVAGPEAAAFFYAAGHLERHTALPAVVVNTLFGRGAVHTLDGDAHRARKAIFVDLLVGDGVETLVKQAGEAFDETAERWRGGSAVSLFDEAAQLIAKTVTRWAGVPLHDREVPALAADLVAMVDGFATAGPRMWRALRAWPAGALLGTFAQRLARLEHYLPPQDLQIDLGRIPARPASRVRIVVP